MSYIDKSTAHFETLPNNSPTGVAATGAMVAKSSAAANVMAGAGSLVSRRVVRGLARFTECIILTAIGFALAYVYVPHDDLWATSQYASTVMATGLLSVLIFDALELYSVRALSSLIRQLTRLALGWTAAMALLAAGVFFLKIGPEISRVWVALWFSFGAIAIVAIRSLFTIQVRRWMRSGRLDRRAVIFGGGPTAASLMRALARDPASDLRICGVFDDPDAIAVQAGNTTWISRQPRHARRPARYGPPIADRHRHSKYPNGRG